MSRTKRGAKGPVDYWSKRKGNRHGMRSPTVSGHAGSRWQKRTTMHQERRAADADLRKEVVGLCGEEE